MKALIPILSLATCALHAQEADLAQKLANPISDLISVPSNSHPVKFLSTQADDLS